MINYKTKDAFGRTVVLINYTEVKAVDEYVKYLTEYLNSRDYT